MEIHELPIGFEIEAYVLRNGKPFIFPKDIETRFWEASGDLDRFHPVMNFMIEGKTFPVSGDIEESASVALANLNQGLATLKKLANLEDLNIRCDANVYDFLHNVPEQDKEDAGTHVHVDFKVLMDYLKEHNPDIFPEALVWHMRQKIPYFIKNYCYSQRLKRKLSDPREPDFAYLGTLPENVYRQTLSYREEIGTIELVVADTTEDINTLISLGRDFKRCAVDSAEYLAKHPDFVFPIDPNERVRQMIVLLNGHYSGRLGRINVNSRDYVFYPQDKKP